MKAEVELERAGINYDIDLYWAEQDLKESFAKCPGAGSISPP